MFSIHLGIALLKTGKLSLEFREGKFDSSAAGLVGPAALCASGSPAWGRPFRRSGIVKGAERERPPGCPVQDTEGDGLGAQGRRFLLCGTRLDASLGVSGGTDMMPFS